MIFFEATTLHLKGFKKHNEDFVEFLLSYGAEVGCCTAEEPSIIVHDENFRGLTAIDQVLPSDLCRG